MPADWIQIRPADLASQNSGQAAVSTTSSQLVIERDPLTGKTRVCLRFLLECDRDLDARQWPISGMIIYHTIFQKSSGSTVPQPFCIAARTKWVSALLYLPELGALER